MGGGRTADGVKIYRRVDGAYIRVVPYKKISYKKVETLIIDSWNGFGTEQLILDSLGLGNKMGYLLSEWQKWLLNMEAMLSLTFDMATQTDLDIGI